MLSTKQPQQQQPQPQQQQMTRPQPWESRSTLSESFAGLGTRLSRILSSSTGSTVSLSSTLAGDMFKKQDSVIDPTDIHSRSLSRGRDAFQSSGRGGAGNIRRTSSSRGPATTATDGPDDFSQTRGREISVTPAVTHTGRGGAGNIRSPSRGRPQQQQQQQPPSSPSSPIEHEKEVIMHYAQREAELPYSSGRGGAGNIVAGMGGGGAHQRAVSPAVSAAASAAHSRSRSGVRSSGRGGAGNMVSPATTDTKDIARLDELERIKHFHAEGIHSTGRGGMANFASSPSPGIDLPPIHESEGHSVVVSSGRGGAGNMRRASQSRTRAE